MPESYDLLCLSHLRWDFVFQRPQHLLTRFDKGRVFFVEEPVFWDGPPRMQVTPRTERVNVCVPHLPERERLVEGQRMLLDQLLRAHRVQHYLRWHYTPQTVPFSRHLKPLLTIYDCMDELSHFKFAPAELLTLEKELFSLADLVFTGGQSLYEHKRQHHTDVHPFPSSVDVAHFRQAREPQADPPDQQAVPRPRAGYFGVIDERINLVLLGELARLRPDWQFVMVGPLCKLEPEELPQAPNLHYLGPKPYQRLPAYLSGWSVAMMPFALNDATRFISPTKTPEYLAGGRPVVSSSVRDVVRPYLDLGLVHIADNSADWAMALDLAVADNSAERLRRADEFLARNSWDLTWERMQKMIDSRLARRLEKAHV